MSVKEALKKIPGLQPLARSAKALARELKAIPNHLAQRKHPKGDGPVKVGFLCQYIPIWHKLKPIYENMLADPRFEPVLICVPSNILDGKLTGENTENDTLAYFLSQGYREALDAMQPDGSWLPLEPMGLDYIFYPRPYDTYMPTPYQSRLVSRYSKICMILYGMNTTQEVTSTTISRTFFRYVYCYFAELPYSREKNISNGWLLHKLRLQESVYYGMPGIEAIREAENASRPAWDFAKGGLRVLWCPRWTTDLSLGGSNFFTYYQVLLEFARENGDYDFLFRPHPLALQHFQQTGEMTAQEAAAFTAQCEALSNVSLDKEKEYAATFWGTDVMISDISGMIPEYFVTGKPLIFCASNMVLTPEASTAKIISASYVVHNADQLRGCLKMLKAGIDPLKIKREQLVRELYSEALSTPAAKITEHLAKR
ncbi:MAG: CDP-glycerol glycerophosphotransferase family protein [Oscillospiraceae bacterium]|nr:CDP-glycerol glycerophosphotransferase family protein [Oscillospiraceae bacterium]